MNSDGKYVRDPDFQKKGALNSQEALIERATKRQTLAPASRTKPTLRTSTL
jgi:hypothetical protein